jgi:hypothetical protein
MFMPSRMSVVSTGLPAPRRPGRSARRYLSYKRPVPLPPVPWAKRSFTDQEAAFFVNVDFVNHVALVALIDEEGRSVIAGGGRYIVLQPGEA